VAILKEKAMNISHRPYKGLKYFIALTSILAIGRKTDTTTFSRKVWEKPM
jgi:hypothetical protein